ncbi:hypothetical protein LY13_001670 [Prauserella aidingensis]|uniref:DUF3592 domain-containing protein n=1 Tax=Prauserella aidingensis TaxID=387890 RepID=UPI0020A335BB|nr:DUF3592 domain-containing protein [Prauserella aidingensis]MCP2252926.1 hypothetical protein [Prauserella aidingensis]
MTASDPRRQRAWRIGAWVVLGLALLITLECAVLSAGAWVNDRDIAENRGAAVAQVEQVTWDRTLIRFDTPDGESHNPDLGVLYPQGLSEGQLVRVEYDTTEPDLVKVAGRTWVLTLLPTGTTALFTWLVAGPLLWFLRRQAGGRIAPHRWRRSAAA